MHANSVLFDSVVVAGHLLISGRRRFNIIARRRCSTRSNGGRRITSIDTATAVRYHYTLLVRATTTATTISITAAVLYSLAIAILLTNDLCRVRRTPLHDLSSNTIQPTEPVSPLLYTHTHINIYICIRISLPISA